MKPPIVTAESLRGRHLVGSLARGDDLIAGIKRACREYVVRSGELRGFGALEQVELCSFDQANKRWTPPRLIDGGLELIQLYGTISEQAGATSVVLRATLMRDRDTGLEVVAGHVLSARVFTVEYVIDAFDDVVLRRHHEPSVGLGVWSDAVAPSARLPNEEALETTVDQVDPVTGALPELGTGPGNARRPSPAPAPTPAPSSQVMAPSAAASGIIGGTPVPPRRTPITPESPAPDDDVSLEPGDVIVHPRFRRCTVQRVEGNHEFVQVRLRNGRVIRLSLDVIRLTPQGTEDGQRVFAAAID